MPTKAEVYRAADKLLAVQKRVSLRNVIGKLPRGGSNRTVGPLLRDWKAERVYMPALEVRGLPERLQAALTKAAKDMWLAAQEEAAAQLEIERRNAAAWKRASDEILDEMMARLDVAQAEN